CPALKRLPREQPTTRFCGVSLKKTLTRAATTASTVRSSCTAAPRLTGSHRGCTACAARLRGSLTDVVKELGALLRVRKVRGEQLKITAFIARFLCSLSTVDDGDWTHEPREHALAECDRRIRQRAASRGDDRCGCPMRDRARSRGTADPGCPAGPRGDGRDDLRRLGRWRGRGPLR